MAPRYVTLTKIASGGVADVFVGAARGALGFRQLVAIKRPHAYLAEDSSFRSALVAEAHVAARLHHANVVDVRDVEVDDESGTVQLVMDYVEGASLAELVVHASQSKSAIPPEIAVRIALDAAAGLQAAHDLADDDGRPLAIVHRDVSPQNVLVGLDGVARVTDFGIAKSMESTASEFARATTEGTLKGKVGYMSPEYVRGGAIDRRADVFALGVVLWESLAGKRLFRGASDVETLEKIAAARAPKISEVVPSLGDRLDAVLARALERVVEARFPTARAFARALEEAAQPDLVARPEDVAAYVRRTMGDALDERKRKTNEALKTLENEPIREERPPVANADATRAPAVEAAPSAIADATPSRATKKSTSMAWLLAGAVLVVGGGAVLATMRSRDEAPNAPVPSTTNAPPPLTASSPTASSPTTSSLASSSSAPTLPSPTPSPRPTLTPTTQPTPPIHTTIHTTTKPSATSTKPHPPPNPYVHDGGA